MTSPHAPTPIPAARVTLPVALLVIASLAVVTLLVYWPALSGQLVYDDHMTVAQNPLITSLANLPRMFVTPMWGPQEADAALVVAYWRPFTTAAMSLAYTLGGTQPFWFHVLSLTLHVLATWLAFRLALRWTGSTTAAFIGALLFAVHPSHVESVAWISALSDLLYACFALLSLERFLAWRDRGSIGVPIGPAALFLAALLSRELAVAVLPIALGLDLARGDEQLKGRWKSRAFWSGYIPFGLALIAYYLGRVGVFGDARAGFDRVTTHFGVSPARLLALRFELIGTSLRLITWPNDTSLFRPFVPALPAFSAAFLVPLTILAAWVAALAVAWRRNERVLFGVVWIALAAVLPLALRVEALGIFPVSDRFLYLSVLGVTTGAGVLLVRWLPAQIATLIALLIAGVLGWRSHARTLIWQDDETLLRYSVAQNPRGPFGHWALGRVLFEKYRLTLDTNELREAHRAFQTALDLAALGKQQDATIFVTRDDFVQSNLGLGWVLMAEAEIDSYRDFASAASVFRNVTQTYPSSEEGFTGLGVALMKTGDFEGAELALRRAIELNSRFPEAHRNLGALLMQRGKFAEARVEYGRALELKPGHLDYLVDLAGACERLGLDDETLEIVERAARLHPTSPRPAVMLGSLAAKHGRLDQALPYFESALELDRNYGDAWLQKAKVLNARGEQNGALRSFLRASELLTSSFEAHAGAGAILLQTEGVASAMPYLTRAYEYRPNDRNGTILTDTLVQLQFTSADTLVELARVDADRKLFDSALRWCDRALALDPKNDRGHLLLGGMLEEKGDGESALLAYEKACELRPDSAQYHMRAAALAKQLGHEEVALRHWERALVVLETAAKQDPSLNEPLLELRKQVEAARAESL